MGIGASAASAAPPAARAELGHKDFVTPTCNDPALPLAAQLCHPSGSAIDPDTQALFVADSDNNRLLIWPNAQFFRNGEAALVVIGKPDFTIDQTCEVTSASSLCDVNSVLVDRRHNIWVADTDGNRILRFSPPFHNGMKANLVIGQPDFTTAECAGGQRGLCAPRDLQMDQYGNLLVVDSDNNRVLGFKAPLRSGMAASLVIGQPNFDDTGCNRGLDAPTAQTLCGPKGLARDREGNLYVGEDDNNRVLAFADPLDGKPRDFTAFAVFGQPDFSSAECNVGPTGACSPEGVTIGPSGQLIMSDKDNNRILIFDHPLRSRVADDVIGQPDFTSNAPGTSRTTLTAPKRPRTDRFGNLYATDEDNNRLLRFKLR
jgi:sugar lactone lactonase YvrE